MLMAVGSAITGWGKEGGESRAVGPESVTSVSVPFSRGPRPTRSPFGTRDAPPSPVKWVARLDNHQARAGAGGESERT